jgi:hypothetical protein
METMYYIGLDGRKRAISYCVKDVSGRVYAEGSVPATRFDFGSMDENTAGGRGPRRWKPRFLPGGSTITCSHMARRR